MTKYLLAAEKPIERIRLRRGKVSFLDFARIFLYLVKRRLAIRDIWKVYFMDLQMGTNTFS